MKYVLISLIKIFWIIIKNKEKKEVILIFTIEKVWTKKNLQKKERKKKYLN